MYSVNYVTREGGGETLPACERVKAEVMRENGAPVGLKVTLLPNGESVALRADGDAAFVVDSVSGNTISTYRWPLRRGGNGSEGPRQVISPGVARQGS